MFALQRDIASELQAVAFALAATAATAGGSGDNTAANGATINVSTFPSGRQESVAFLIPARAVLAAAATLTVSAKIQTSDDGSGWVDVVAPTTVLTLTGGSGGTTETGVGKIGVSLEYCGTYVRVVVTPDLSAANTDTASVSSVAVFGGPYKLS
ncbi:hypothetical protein [Niveispirillum cyanobacteriorum]|uniref:Uncharacterized protein n=1 Tax=Niveispirillum cyanobacteriorum TaxID=1612173 RepID=A0A2K9NFQ2_9PROT|nr:hypothetical protein [Niveispirillum cyanobacteriorum]AUN31953.1 hypothetical protein C0V82_16110 [Niveispirillum cyanobacteriorum]GGE85462.1 hypothetical protein GCM10011317_48330 [Niveispirillum cyanobacteriorum]